MDVLTRLKLLVDKENGPGIPQTIIAKHAQTTKQTIQQYLRDRMTPTDYMIEQLEKSYQEIYKRMKEVMEAD